MSKDCPERGPARCSNCRREGHFIAECPDPLVCPRCGKDHMVRECPEPMKCNHCHEARKTCSDTRPCNRCMQHGLATSCMDRPRKLRTSRGHGRIAHNDPGTSYPAAGRDEYPSTGCSICVPTDFNLAGSSNAAAYAGNVFDNGAVPQAFAPLDGFEQARFNPCSYENTMSCYARGTS